MYPLKKKTHGYVPASSPPSDPIQIWLSVEKTIRYNILCAHKISVSFARHWHYNRIFDTTFASVKKKKNIPDDNCPERFFFFYVVYHVRRKHNVCVLFFFFYPYIGTRSTKRKKRINIKNRNKSDDNTVLIIDYGQITREYICIVRARARAAYECTNNSVWRRRRRDGRWPIKFPRAGGVAFIILRFFLERLNWMPVGARHTRNTYAVFHTLAAEHFSSGVSRSPF